MHNYFSSFPDSLCEFGFALFFPFAFVLLVLYFAIGITFAFGFTFAFSFAFCFWFRFCSLCVRLLECIPVWVSEYVYACVRICEWVDAFLCLSLLLLFFMFFCFLFVSSRAWKCSVFFSFFVRAQFCSPLSACLCVVCLCDLCVRPLVRFCVYLCVVCTRVFPVSVRMYARLNLA